MRAYCIISSLPPELPEPENSISFFAGRTRTEEAARFADDGCKSASSRGYKKLLIGTRQGIGVSREKYARFAVRSPIVDDKSSGSR